MSLAAVIYINVVHEVLLGYKSKENSLNTCFEDLNIGLFSYHFAALAF